MNARIDQLFAEVRALTTAEQEELVMRLEIALDEDLPGDGTAAEIDPELLALVQRRAAEAERGEAEIVGHEQGMAELRKMLRDEG
jgi:hypothetical protein